MLEFQIKFSVPHTMPKRARGAGEKRVQELAEKYNFAVSKERVIVTPAILRRAKICTVTCFIEDAGELATLAYELAKENVELLAKTRHSGFDTAVLQQ